jgi:DNA-binding GntR family transcriptional regulator
MSRLASDGLLVLRPRRGYAVKALDAREIKEVFDLRTIIEEHAGRLAAAHHGTEDIDRVARILQAMGAIDPTRPQGLREWFDLNRKFHAEIFASSGHAHLCRIAAMLRDTVEPYIRIEVMITGDLDEANTEHHGIFDAFRRGDVDTTGPVPRALRTYGAALAGRTERASHFCGCRPVVRRRRTRCVRILAIAAL